MKSEVFALQLDESTDIQGKGKLLANIRNIENNSMQENFLFCRKIPTHTVGKEIYNVTATCFKEEELESSHCVSVCTDRAPSMAGKYFFPNLSQKTKKRIPM